MRGRSSVVLGLLIVLFATNCAPAAAPAASSGAPAQSATPFVAGGTVTIRFAGDWGKPVHGGHTVTSANGKTLAFTMYDDLVYADPTTGKLFPYVASSWEVTPTSVKFKLRTDVTCSDGTKVTPTVVYNSFERLLSPQTASTWVPTLFGPGPYSTAKDDAAGTFSFSVTKPNTLLATGFADSSAGIICPKGLAPGADFTKESYGSGPYVFKSAVQGSEYVVVKRDGWAWGPNGWRSSDSGFPETLDFKVIASETTAANSLLTGTLDVANVNGPDVKRVGSDGQFEDLAREAGNPYVLFLNHAAGRPTASEAVRKAVITALDSKAWTAAAGEPNSPVSTNIQTVPGGYCYTDLSAIIPKPSVTDARKVLTDAGYRVGAGAKLEKDGTPLKLKVLGTSFTGAGVEYIADALQQVGITVDLVNTDYNTFAQNFGKTDYDVTIGLFAGGTKGIPGRTPLFMVGKSPADGGNNRLNRADATLAALADKAYAAGTDAEACAAWKEFNTYLITNSAALPWSAALYHWFTRKGITYQPSSNTLDPKTVRRTRA